jgi:serine/threonine protein kinase
VPCTLGFNLRCAAPELVCAYENNKHFIEPHAAADVWALGVMAFEMLTKEVIFAAGVTEGQARDALMGRACLPWEDTILRLLQAPLLRSLRGTLMACLARDKGSRVSAEELAVQWSQMADRLL